MVLSSYFLIMSTALFSSSLQPAYVSTLAILAVMFGSAIYVTIHMLKGAPPQAVESPLQHLHRAEAVSFVLLAAAQGELVELPLLCDQRAKPLEHGAEL